MAEVKWHGPRVQSAIKREMGKRLRACAIIGQNHAKQLIGIEGTGVGKNGNLRYGKNPSAPGEPPRKQTGRLQSSVAHEVSGLVARIGTNVKYGRYLELGTSDMAPRPWLRRMLIEKSGIFRRILSAPINIGI